MTPDDIAKNISNVKKRIEEAALRSGRNPEDIRLVAVSKKISTEKIEAAISTGADIFGENYIQESQTKIEQLGKKVAWHFIGHLQSNKAKLAVDLFDLIHSVDSLHLAERLSTEAAKNNRVIKILVQVNISGEETKHGINPEKITGLLGNMSALTHLHVCGLMTMPPWSQNPEDARPYFASLRQLRDNLESENLKDVSLDELSMGMSSDFEIAIEEGSTLVRVGTSIFGARQ
jgi:pyridoxal phosphate enzyme (YggS family)